MGVPWLLMVRGLMVRGASQDAFGVLAALGLRAVLLARGPVRTSDRAREYDRLITYDRSRYTNITYF